MHPRHWTCTWWGWLVWISTGSPWKLCVWRKNRSWFFGAKFPQALHRTLGTFFWRKTLRVAKKTGVDFLERNFHRLSIEPWALCFGWKLKTLRAAKKPQLIFWNKISSSIIGEKAGRVLPLCKASSGYTRKNWVGFHIKNIIADSKTTLTSDFFTGDETGTGSNWGLDRVTLRITLWNKIISLTSGSVFCFVFFLNFGMLLKWQSSIRICSQICQCSKYERRKILSTLSCCKQLWSFLVISFLAFFFIFKQGSFWQNVILQIFFTQWRKSATKINSLLHILTQHKIPWEHEPRETHRKAQSSFFSFSFLRSVILHSYSTQNQQRPYQKLSEKWLLITSLSGCSLEQKLPRSVCAQCLRHRCVCVREEKQKLFEKWLLITFHHTQSGPDPARHPVLDVGYPGSLFRARMS